MNIPGLKNLCNPSLFYLVISMAAIIVMAFQNVGGTNVYCLGSYNCNVSSVSMVFLLKIIYVLFWTWVLNIICRGGSPALAWFLVLIPYILLFVLVGLMLLK
jgi:hypothetical protein